MQKVHRHGDKRSCGATTEAQGHSNVFVNNQPILLTSDITNLENLRAITND